jgi:DNA mismatch repair protein MutL
MSNIRVLSEDVANQIAAGEVIERPASVVRELLDNSIDAGADRISISIEEGGKRLIRVSDNGTGMSKDDLLLSFERHATSKINSISDLFSVHTLGFRGEALPSIASVSKMEITSCLPGQIEAYRLKIAGGQYRSIDAVGAPAGTLVQVRDLFFNTPARRKFLRAIRTETNHIVDTVSRIVLPFMNIQLKLESEGKAILNIPSSITELNRLSALLGGDVAGSLIKAYYNTDGFSISAYLAPPDKSRNRNDRLFVYINKRSIKDRLVTRAIMEGYGQRLMKGRYPQIAMFLEINPSLVDVNVHPTKQEVRFHQGQQIFKTIVAFIDRTLRENVQAFSLESYVKTETLGQSPVSAAEISEKMWEYSPVEYTQEIDMSAIDHEEHFHKRGLRIIGQLKNTYILCENPEGFIILDQHAAHERIVYEGMKKAYGSSNIEKQAFLIPQRLEVSVKDARIIKAKMDQLSDLGLEIEDFGGNTFILRSVPSVLVGMKWDEFLIDLLPILNEESNLSSDKAMDRLLTSIACHSAIRAGKRMTPQEMVDLIGQLEEMDLPTNCPHGRPVFKKFTFYEIEKMFKRIV